MGVLIVAGVVTIVVTIANRMSDKAPPSPAVSVVAPPPPKPFGEIAMALPNGARVISVSADAGRLYIHYGAAGGQPFVMVMDAFSGNALGRFRFEPDR